MNFTVHMGNLKPKPRRMTPRLISSFTVSYKPILKSWKNRIHKGLDIDSNNFYSDNVLVILGGADSIFADRSYGLRRTMRLTQLRSRGSNDSFS